MTGGRRHGPLTLLAQGHAGLPSAAPFAKRAGHPRRAHREPASPGRFTAPVIFPPVAPRRRHAGGRFPLPDDPDSGPAARPARGRAASEKRRSTVAPLSSNDAP